MTPTCRTVALASVMMIAVSSSSDASPCPVPTLHATAITKPNTVIEDGGGVIVALSSSFGAVTSGEELPRSGPAANDPDPVVRSGWRFQDARKLVTPTIDTIAPGLAIYHLPASKSQAYTLETGAHKAVVSVRRSSERDVSGLGAPVVVGGGLTTFTGRRGGGAFVMIHLATTPPKGASMMVAYGPDHVARSFAVVDPSTKDAMVWRTRGGCEMAIPGEIATSVGDKITVAWLDESGRLSAKSAPIEIKQERQK